MDKVPQQQSVDIWPIPFQNYNTISDQHGITGKSFAAFQPKYPLQYVVYPISESNS